jgi:hypothetical protein
MADDEHDNNDNEHDNDDSNDDDDAGVPATLEAALERLAVVERELAETRRESIGRRRRIGELEGELSTLREQGMGEQERAVEQARREEREKLEAEHRSERVRASLLLAASTKLRDPQDAVRYVDLDALAEHEDGQLDRAAGRAIDELLEQKDYLAAGADDDATSGVRSPGPRQRQPAGGRVRETDMNARIRKQLRR